MGISGERWFWLLVEVCFGYIISKGLWLYQCTSISVIVSRLKEWAKNKRWHRLRTNTKKKSKVELNNIIDFILTQKVAKDFNLSYLEGVR